MKFIIQWGYLIYVVGLAIIFIDFCRSTFAKKSVLSDRSEFVVFGSGIFILAKLYAFVTPPFCFVPYLMLFTLVWRAAFRNRPAELPWNWSNGSYIGATLLVTAIGLFGLSFEYGKTPAEGINLAFPFRKDTLLVFKGGVTGIFNHHVSVPEQRWALDIGYPITFNTLKAAALGDPSQAHIFGQPVYSSCNGQVTEVVDSFPDLPIGEMDPDNPVGNYVRIQCMPDSGEPFILRLAHLKQNSIRVKADQLVTLTDQIGEVGNSGNTSYPHLHMDISRQNGEERLGLPIFFDRNFYRAADSYQADEPRSVPDHISPVQN